MDTLKQFGAVPAGSSRIYLVRHGRTVMNTQVRFRGRREVPLDEVGRREAWDAAHGLSGARLSSVYSSPLRRAIEVGEAISAVNELGEVRPLADLLNLDYGVWEGMTKEESADHDPVAFEQYLNEPGARRLPRWRGRLGRRRPRGSRAAQHRRRPGSGTSVAAVTHGVMVRLAVLRVAGATEDDWQFAMPTASAVVFDVADGEISLAQPIDRSDPDPRKSGTYLFQSVDLEAVS